MWASSYYQSPAGLFLRMTLPPPGAALKGPRFQLTEEGRQESLRTGSPFADILGLLSRGPRTSRFLTDRFDSTFIEEALSAGLLKQAHSRTRSGSLPPGSYSRDEDPVTVLTPDQENALRIIEGASLEKGFSPFLLKGVTGSGKTEVYLRAARNVLDRGMGVLFLVPEISLTPLLISRLEKIAPGEVVPLHSGLSVSARTSGWEALRGGHARLAVAVRSGVFSPVPDLGLIIVDEEHDTSFRQEDTPSYHARDVAVKRAQLESVPIVLGSATPSIESWHNTRTGRYTLLSLPERVTPYPGPELVLIDMSNRDQIVPDLPFLSRTLVDELEGVLDRGEQAVLFLNRRGFAPFLLCDQCHNTVLCPNCSVTLTYHSGKEMICHYCGQKEDPPATCPECRAPGLRPVGTGTRKVEKALAERFPEASIDRLDRDALGTRGALEQIYRRMDSGDTRILVGTQMLSKGHDFAGVTLAGILNAEQALDLPDFRSAERTFQIITQVAGRAGRGESKGKVIVQTWVPENYAVLAALQGDSETFYETEMSFRKDLGYPPFRRLGRIIIDGVSEEKVIRAAQRITKGLPRGKGLTILGPSPAPIQKIRNRFRWHIMVLAGSHGRLLQTLSGATAFQPPGVRVTARVDPVQLL
jgi:primosomal protein N' (replication factor Y)